MMTIDADALTRHLTTQFLGRAIVFYEEVDSTNLSAKALGRAGAEHGTLVLTQRQSAGRGRRGRSWLSQEGALCFSLVLRPEFSLALAPRYVVALAVGVCRALRAFGADAGIKWPNDVMAGGKKLSGILMEADASGFVVAGVGVNVNQSDFPAPIAEIASSLYCETGVGQDINAFAAAVLIECEPLLCACQSEAGFAGVLTDYRALSLTLGQRVRVIETAGEYFGTAVDLDALGMLEVIGDDGIRKVVGAGDVSIRGI